MMKVAVYLVGEACGDDIALICRIPVIGLSIVSHFSIGRLRSPLEQTCYHSVAPFLLDDNVHHDVFFKIGSGVSR